MTRLVTLVALVSLIATTGAAQAADLRPTFVDECYDYVLEPTDARQQWDCRYAVADAPTDVKERVEHFTAETLERLRVHEFLP